MTSNRFVEQLARSMLAGDGIAIIWRLHIAAATLFRRGNEAAARTFLEIADAAERGWRQPASSALRERQGAVKSSCKPGRGAQNQVPREQGA